MYLYAQIIDDKREAFWTLRYTDHYVIPFYLNEAYFALFGISGSYIMTLTPVNTERNISGYTTTGH